MTAALYLRTLCELLAVRPERSRPETCSVPARSGPDDLLRGLSFYGFHQVTTSLLRCIVPHKSWI
jgi:hypothetical protein